jgi:aminopeptidase N
MKRLLSLFVILIAFSAYAQKPYALDPEAKGPRSGIDIEHMLLNISFRPEDGLVYGDVTHTFKTKTDKLDTIFLNGPGIDYKSVQYDGKDVKYTTNKDGIVISPGKKLRLNEEHTVRITYEARPRKGIYFIGWKDTTYGIPVNNHGKELHVSLNQSGIVRRQIWTQGQSEDNRYWLPIDDDPNDKLTTEMKITFAKEDMSQVRDKANSTFRVLSNGEKEDSTDNGNGTITWRYACKKPFAPYLIMIGIGDYGVKPDQNANGVPLQYWYYPNQASAVGPTYKYTPQIMNFYEQEIGIPFQWPKYAQIPVQDFIYGAMENVSATVYGDFFYVTPRQSIDQNYIMVNAHEMAHQWFGDVVTAKSYKDEWLQEGFATHYAKLAERSLFGEDFYQWNRRQEQNTALAASTKNLMPIVNTNGGSGRIYQKASFVLDMLKDTVGRENYNKVVKAYIEKYGFANASTQDFADMFKQWLNMDLQWFFDEWIFRGGEPHYKVSYEDLPQKSQSVTRLNDSG